MYFYRSQPRLLTRYHGITQHKENIRFEKCKTVVGIHGASTCICNFKTYSHTACSLSILSLPPDKCMPAGTAPFFKTLIVSAVSFERLHRLQRRSMVMTAKVRFFRASLVPSLEVTRTRRRRCRGGIAAPACSTFLLSVTCTILHSWFRLGL